MKFVFLSSEFRHHKISLVKNAAVMLGLRQGLVPRFDPRSPKSSPIEENDSTQKTPPKSPAFLRAVRVPLRSVTLCRGQGKDKACSFIPWLDSRRDPRLPPESRKHRLKIKTTTAPSNECAAHHHCLGAPPGNKSVVVFFVPPSERTGGAEPRPVRPYAEVSVQTHA